MAQKGRKSGIQFKFFFNSDNTSFTTIFGKEHTLERALPQVPGTCRDPEGHRGPGRAGREETSLKEKQNTDQVQIQILYNQESCLKSSCGSLAFNLYRKQIKRKKCDIVHTNGTVFKQA